MKWTALTSRSFARLEFSKNMRVVLTEGVTSECPKGGLQIIHQEPKYIPYGTGRRLNALALVTKVTGC
jgi:hypothetical protein